MPAIDSVEYLQNAPSPGYSARQLRGSYLDAYGEGVFGSADYRVTFSAGLTVNVAPGTAYVRGASTASQGLYRCDNTIGRTVTLPAADTTNPRIDQIILQVRDSAEDGGANNDAQVTFIQGTPTPGATLDNRSGVPTAAPASPSYILLADVLVSANNTPAMSSTNVRDRRPFGLPGVVPSSIRTTVLDQVMLVNPAITPVAIRWDSNWNTKQSAWAMFLPRRIAATHMRWRYVQGANNSSAGYNMAMCDASGRLIAQTGVVTLAGAIGTSQRPVLPFTPALPAGYIFDAGWYYVWCALSSIGAGASVGFPGYNVDNGTIGGTNTFASPAQNLVFKSNTGGPNFDPSNTIIGLSDNYNDSSGSNCLPLPQITLSVG